MHKLADVGAAATHVSKPRPRDPSQLEAPRMRGRASVIGLFALLTPDIQDPDVLATGSPARLIEAQWQGAFNQWGFFREGRLPDFVADSLEAWFDLAEAGRR